MNHQRIALSARSDLDRGASLQALLLDPMLGLPLGKRQNAVGETGMYRLVLAQIGRCWVWSAAEADALMDDLAGDLVLVRARRVDKFAAICR